MMLPVLETILSEFGRRSSNNDVRARARIDNAVLPTVNSPAGALLQIQR
jgi:hypothetical protein